MRIVPILGDQVGLGVMGQQRLRRGPTAVVVGRMRTPQPFVGEFRDPRREPPAHQIEEGKGRQGLPMGIGGVFEGRQFGCVTSLSSRT